MPEFQIDEVGYWTEIKLRIIREYSKVYATILNKYPSLQFDYIDGFAGAGKHISRTTGELIEGSPAIALNTTPRFHHYHFVDLNGDKAAILEEYGKGRFDVTVHHGDCNEILLELFKEYRWKDYKRALCLLDPYDLNPNWEVVRKAGEMKTIEIFLNFMIMDANMNVFYKNPDKVPEAQKERMNKFWGDSSWREAGYTPLPTLFGDINKKVKNEAIVGVYRKRLKEVAGFKYVPEPIPMLNTKGATIYYLFFASPKESGAGIVRDIFNKYRSLGI
jgi:three-Cys-motif partner protein